MADNSYIAEFIRDNMDYLRRKDLEGMYSLLEFYDRKHLTSIFMEQGINPLKFMENIPKSYASTLPIDTIPFSKKNKKIGAKAFSNCSALEELFIPEGIELIGVMTFYGCDNLRTISLPKSLKVLSRKSFGQCAGVEKITYAGTVEEFYELDARSAFESYNWGAVPVSCSDEEIVL
jgi:hypothetical protein